VRTIHKHIVSSAMSIALPWGSRILSAQVQGNEVCIWVECNDGERSDLVDVFVIGTGHPVPAEAVNYVGTVQMPPYVWHVYTGALPV
jgi:hypothetical protein